MNRKKLIICSKYLGEIYSGWGKFSETLANHLQKDTVEVIFQGKYFYTISDNQKKLKLIPILKSLWSVKTVFFPNFYDYNYFRILFYKIILNKKVIIRICANELRYRRPIKLRLMTMIMNLVDYVIVLNLEKKEYLENLLKNKNKILYIPNPVSAFYLEHKEKDLQKERKNILFVGSICERKGVLDLINAYKRSDAIHNHCLELIGPMGYGESKPEYMEKVKDAIGDLLDKKIFLQDALSKQILKEKYLSSKIFVLPSYSEGMPNVLLEAMACGMICIGSDIGGIRENLTDDKTGYIFEPGNIDALSLMLNNSIALHNNKIGNQANQFIMNDRNPMAVFNQYWQII